MWFYTKYRKQIYLGEFPNCIDTVKKAKATYKKVNNYTITLMHVILNKKSWNYKHNLSLWQIK